MSLNIANDKSLVVLGDNHPVDMYLGSDKIAGYHTETKSGESVTFANTYNDTADVELLGNTVQASDYYAKDGLSSQTGTPSPNAPIAITSNLPAGTYKTTYANGDIYEFILTEELRGINGLLDKIVHDRKSHRGIIERRIAKRTLNGTETWYKSGSALNGYQCAFTDGLNNSLHLCSHSMSTLSLTTYYNNFNYSVMFGGFNININPIVCGNTVALFKAWLALNPVTAVYQLATPTRTPLTFTKVASSSATEVPMTFLTNTPSLDYPADVVDASGNLLSNGAVVGAMPTLRKVGAVSDSHVMRTGVKTKRIEKISSYAGQSITTPYLSTTGALTTGATVLYQLAVPVTEQYAPTPVPTHLGQTIISTDSAVKPTLNVTAKVPD